MISDEKSRMQCRWISPTIDKLEKAAPLIAEGTAAGRMMEHLRTYGSIEVTGAKTPKDELSELLKIAAEVEHALLLQYLYAAYSVDPDASFESGQAQRKILDVAIQEMAHLITVQNLILAIDGPNAYHIGRETVRLGNSLNPLPFLLEPVSKLSLSQYVIAEMPAEFPLGKEAIATRAKKLEADVLAATGFSPHRVGALYAKIYWILQPTDAPFGPISLQPDPLNGYKPGWHIKARGFTKTSVIREHEATPDEWNASAGPDMRIHSVTNAQSAIDAVSSVMEQGEGLGHDENSHFYEFLETIDMFEAGQVPVFPIATNPFVGHLAPGVITGSPLTQNYVRLWANLLNSRYSMLMLDMGHALTLKASDNDRVTLVDSAFRNMFRVRDITKQLISPSMRALDANSAPTFELLREDLPSTPRDRWRRQREYIDLEQQISVELFASPEINSDLTGKFLLDDIATDRLARKALVDSRLSS